MACKDMNGIIADRPVYVRQWPASVALENLSEALQLFGATIAPYIEGNPEMQDAIRLLNTGNSKETAALIKKFVSAVRVDGRDINQIGFDVEYSGDLKRIFETLAFVCRVNYADFFVQGAEQQTPDPAQS